MKNFKFYFALFILIFSGIKNACSQYLINDVIVTINGYNAQQLDLVGGKPVTLNLGYETNPTYGTSPVIGISNSDFYIYASAVVSRVGSDFAAYSGGSNIPKYYNGSSYVNQTGYTSYTSGSGSFKYLSGGAAATDFGNGVGLPGNGDYANYNINTYTSPTGSGATIEGYYKVVVTLNDYINGIIQYRTFYFIYQTNLSIYPTPTFPNATLNIGSGDCLRTAASSYTFFSARKGTVNTFSAQLYKNGTAIGSPVNATNTYTGAPLNQTVTSTFANITQNGSYYAKITATFPTFAGSLGGSTDPRYAPTAYTATTTITNLGIASNAAHYLSLQGSNTPGTQYFACQAATKVVNIWNTNSAANTTTATITRYSSSTYTTPYSTPWSKTIVSSSSADGNYDLKTISANGIGTYMSNQPANSGFYKITVTTTTTCGDSPKVNNFYLNWGLTCKTDDSESFSELSENSNNENHSESDASSVDVYPIPASGTITLKLPLSFYNSDIRVLDIQGRTLDIHTSKKSDSERLLDFSPISKGIYFIKIDGGKITKKVIIE